MLKRLLAPPIFPDDEEKTRIASLLNTVLLFLFLTPLLFVVDAIRIPANRLIIAPIFVILTGSLLAMVYFMHRGYVRAVSAALVVFLLILVTYLSILGGGEARPVTIYYAFIIVVAGVVLGGWGAITLAVLSLVSLGIVTYGGATGLFKVRMQPPTTDLAVIVYGVGFVLIGIVLRLAAESISTALDRAHADERELSERNRELQNLRESLEQQVAERTAQLAEREIFYSGILNSTGDAIITVNEVQQIISFSQSAERIFGYTSNEVIGQPLDMLLPSQLIHIHRQHIRSFGDEFEQANVMRMHREVYGRRKDGTEFPTETAISKLILDGKITFTAFMRDISERRQMEQQIAAHTTRLAEREAFLSGIFNTAGDAIITMDEKQRILSFSQSAERIFGYTSSEIIGQPLDLLLPPQFIQVHRQHIHNFGDASESSRIMALRREVNGRRKDGTQFPAEASISKLILNDKLTFTAFMRDVTERKQMEKALREEEERFRKVFENSPVAIVVTTLEEGRTIKANDAYWKLSGHDPKTAIGKTTTELRAGYDVVKRQEFIKTLLEKKSIQNPNYVFKDDAGRDHFTLAFFELIELDGQPTILSMFYDMTEQVEAQEALQSSELQVRGLLNAIPDAIFEIRRDGTVLQYIPSDETFSQESPQDLLGKPIDQIMSAPIAKQIMFVMERTLESGQLHIIEYQLPQTGNEKIYEARVAVSGEDTVLMIMRDISLQKWLESERENLINELDSKSSELERFTYAVSHDLKSPLITVQGFLGFLKQDIASGNAPRAQIDIQRMSDALETMQHRLDDVLELSRVGRLTNKLEEIRFNDLVAEALELVHGRISQGGIIVHVDENLPLIIGDHQRLLEVIQNLIDNAAKFMRDQTNPLIEIGQRGEDAGRPIFFVKDNGMGIPPEHHEKIFGIFNKLDPKAEGTGIGLSLVRKIIEAHGGRIWVESEAGKGSTFCFTLGKK